MMQCSIPLHFSSLNESLARLLLIRVFFMVCAAVRFLSQTDSFASLLFWLRARLEAWSSLFLLFSLLMRGELFPFASILSTALETLCTLAAFFFSTNLRTQLDAFVPIRLSSLVV